MCEHTRRVAWTTVNGVRLCEAPGLAQGHSGEGYAPLDNWQRILHAATHRYDIVHMFDHKPNVTFASFPARWRRARLIADWADWWGGPGGVNDVANRRFPVVGQFEAWWEVRSKRLAHGVVTISRASQGPRPYRSVVRLSACASFADRRTD